MNKVEAMFENTNGIGDFCHSYFDYLHQLLKRLDVTLIERIAVEMEAARTNRNTVFVVGNGGSAVTATHMANDFGTDILKKSGTAIPFMVHALTDNNAVMMAVANDDGYDRIFVNQLRVHYRPGDKLLAISASGNSPNVVEAAKWVKEQGGVVMSFVGFQGGQLKEISDVTVHVESNPGEYGPVEDIHLILNHLLANYLQYKVFKDVKAGELEMNMLLKDEKILLGPSSFADQNRAPLEKLAATGCSIVDNPYKRKITKEELTDLLQSGITGIIAGLETLDRSVLENSQLKVISRCGAGMNNVDVAAAAALGILVYSTPNGPTQAVAELTVGCLLSLLRQVPQMNHSGHAGKWNKQIGRQLKGMTVLVIGFGRIGQLVAKLLDAFDVKILVCDPGVEQSNLPYPLVRLDEGLSQADVITIHASGETCILGAKEFSLLKRGSFILNAARGGIVDENLLMESIESGLLAGVWLDTFSQEPYRGPLAKYEQVLMTPHVGSYTHEGRLQMELDTVDNLILGFQKVKAAR